MGIKLTKEQSDAVFCRGRNTLVAAAAGSGKTRVLIERVMSRISSDENYNVDDFLIITFTRAAAAELRDRLEREISERIRANPSDRKLRRQLTLLPSAQITTIDSFCHSVLSEFSYLCDTSPVIRILEGAEAELLRNEALENAIESLYDEIEELPDFVSFAETLSASRDDRLISQTVSDAYNKIQSHPFPNLWMDRMLKLYESTHERFDDTPWGKYLLDTAVQFALNGLDALDRALKLLDEEPVLAEKYRPIISGDRAQTVEFLNKARSGWDDAVKAASLPVKKLSAAPRNYSDPVFRDYIKSLRERWKKSWNRIGEMLAEPGDVHLAEMRSSLPVLRGLFLAVVRFEEKYSALKSARGVMDFNDISHSVIKLLCTEENNRYTPTEVARQIGSRYVEVLIDEFQDTNELQDLLARMITEGRHKLFMVGDVKQSIYRFRLAEPEIFQKYYSTYDDYAEDMEPGDPARVILSMNFRSRPEVIDSVNSIFSHLMIGGHTQITYGKREFLYCGRDCEVFSKGESPYNTEFCVIDVKKSDDDEEESAENLEIEAEYVAGRIKEMLDEGFIIGDSDEKRSVTCDDIVILLRSVASKAVYFERALSARGIQATTDRGGERTAELLTMLSILAVIDNAYQDIPLVGMMTSPVCRFSHDELSQLRTSHRSGAVYDIVKAAAKRGDKKCEDFIRYLEQLREYSNDNGVDRLIWHIYSTTGLPAIYSAMMGGASRRRNLMLLYEYAVEYEKGGRRGISGFVNYIEKMLSNGTFSSEDSQRPGAVKIETIHKSKGMEYPVVFLCGLSGEFNLNDTRSTVLVHPKAGIGLKILDRERLYQYPTAVYTAISDRIREESLAEEMRILYVAMTRAKEKLILTCSLKDAEKKVSSIINRTELDNLQDLRSANSPSKWLLPIIASHPSGKVLREIAETTEFSPSEPGEWDVKFISESGTSNEVDEDETEQDYSQSADARQTPPDATERSGITQIIENRMEYNYPYSELTDIPSKITPTQLKGKAFESELSEMGDYVVDTSAISTNLDVPVIPATYTKRDVSQIRPKFLSGSTGLTPTEKGTALHLAMQFVDLSKCVDINSIESEIARLKSMEIISAEQADAVEPKKILGFIQSDLGRRMLASKTVNREFKFSFLDDVVNYHPIKDSTDKVLVQGVCDLFFEEEDGLVIVDFKSDRISSKGLSQRTKLYRPQINLYARALERITGKKVAEKHLYFFALDKSVAV